MGLLKLSFAYWKENEGRDKKADKIQLHRMKGAAGQFDGDFHRWKEKRCDKNIY